MGYFSPASSRYFLGVPKQVVVRPTGLVAGMLGRTNHWPGFFLLGLS